MMEADLSPIGMIKVRTEERPRPMSIHKYLPVALLYFFFNSCGLPTGLFFTTILAPVFYLWLYLRGQRYSTIRFLLLLSPFFVAHAVLGIGSPAFYLRSTLLLWTAYITAFAFCWGLLHTRDMERLFDELIITNFFASLISLILLSTPARSVVWDTKSSVLGLSHLYRLKLLTSEPSVYAGLMMPLIVFASLRLLRAPGTRNLIYLLMISFPFLLCQSFGGVGSFVIGIGVASLFTFRQILRKRKAVYLAIMMAIVVGALFLIPNPLSDRLQQVTSGNDSSAHSRTIFSFYVAYAVASTKSIWWGAGLGQSKLVNVSNLGIGFSVGVIPNAVAGTFAELGIVGVMVRFAVEIVLFFRTRVLTNPFRLAMFVVAFATQLSGSYLDNVQEYIMWCLAFAPFFPQMDKQSLTLGNHNA